MSKFTQILTVILIFGAFFAFPAMVQASQPPTQTQTQTQPQTTQTQTQTTQTQTQTQEGTEWTKDVLQSMYMQYLREEGYLPSLDEDGDILFKVSGNNYFIIIDENDFQNNLLFFRIYTGVSLGEFLPENALTAANYINMHSKVAKVYISSDGRSAAINTELLLTNPQDFKVVLSRALSLMRFAENNFFSQLGAGAS